MCLATGGLPQPGRPSALRAATRVLIKNRCPLCCGECCICIWVRTSTRSPAAGGLRQSQESLALRYPCGRLNGPWVRRLGVSNARIKDGWAPFRRRRPFRAATSMGLVLMGVRRSRMRAATRSSTQGERPRALVVVCPTEYGGHVEHAAELAAAATRSGLSNRSFVLTRPGAGPYLEGWAAEMEVAEVLSPRRGGPSFVRGIRQLVDIARDRVAIRSFVQRMSEKYEVDAIYETGRYGMVRIPPGGVNVLFVHNVVPHAISHLSIRDRLLHKLQRASAHRADRVVVHGAAQRDVVAGWTDREVVSVDLPGDTRHVQIQPVDGLATPVALCLGEVRPNKGIETAIEAAALAGVPLTVAGRPEPEWYGDELRRSAAGSPVVLQLDFLSPEEFAWLLESAKVVLLPYRTFAAQSGVLARAMQLDKQVVLSDLPALREQADGYARARFFPVGNAQEAASALKESVARSDQPAQVGGRLTDRDRWCEVVGQILLPPAASLRVS